MGAPNVGARRLDSDCPHGARSEQQTPIAAMDAGVDKLYPIGIMRETSRQRHVDSNIVFVQLVLTENPSTYRRYEAETTCRATGVR